MAMIIAQKTTITHASRLLQKWSHKSIENSLVPRNEFIRNYSPRGILGEGVGKGGGGGGSIRSAGGAFGRRSAAKEEKYFYMKQKSLLQKLRDMYKEGRTPPKKK